MKLSSDFKNSNQDLNCHKKKLTWHHIPPSDEKVWLTYCVDYGNKTFLHTGSRNVKWNQHSNGKSSKTGQNENCISLTKQFYCKEPESESVKSLSPLWLFATPWTVAHQAPLSMEFSRQEYWSGLPFPIPRDLQDPGIGPRFPALQADSLSEPQGKPGERDLCDYNPHWF